MPEDMRHFRRYQEKRRLRVVSGLVQKEKVTQVLDLGCGSGWLSEILHRKGFRVSAIDLGLDSLKRASVRLKKRNIAIPFISGDIYNLPFCDAHFDAVVASEVLEHLEKPHDALNEIARIIRPGGYCIVSTPYRERIEEILCIHCNKKTPVNAHLHTFDEKIMEHMLLKSGFELQKCITFANIHTEHLGIAGLTFFLPYSIWRVMDALACKLLARQSYMAVRAVKKDE
ncbi:class I SAM-dependent methyltransferase [Candidatus Latescibacterota bacterium]